MNKKLRNTILAGAAFGVLSLSPQAFAQTPIDPDFTSKQGFENPDVVEKCNLSGVEARVRLNSPDMPGDTTGENNGETYEAVFEDRGDGLIFVDDLTPGPDQFLGTAAGGGVDFVVQKVNTTFNLYCLVTAADVLAQGIDGGRNIGTNHVEVGWALPLCRAQEANVTALCMDFNPGLGTADPPTDAETISIIGDQMFAIDPLMACGCGNVVANRCDQGSGNGFNLLCSEPTADFEGQFPDFENSQANFGATISAIAAGASPLGVSAGVLDEVETLITKKQARRLCRVCNGGTCSVDQECMTFYGF